MFYTSLLYLAAFSAFHALWSSLMTNKDDDDDAHTGFLRLTTSISRQCTIGFIIRYLFGFGIIIIIVIIVGQLCAPL